MGLYHLGLFLLRRKFKSPLYFSIFCLLIVLRSLLINERYLYVLLPKTSWAILLKMEYLSFYLSLPILAMFIFSLFPKDFSIKALRLIQVFALIFLLKMSLFKQHLFFLLGCLFLCSPRQFFYLCDFQRHWIEFEKQKERLQNSRIALILGLAKLAEYRDEGTGYPKGLKGEAIPLSARITAVADVYDALTPERPYKKAFSHQKSMDIIISDSGKHFDPNIIEAFCIQACQFEKIQEDILD